MAPVRRGAPPRRAGRASARRAAMRYVAGGAGFSADFSAHGSRRCPCTLAKHWLILLSESRSLAARSSRHAFLCFASPTMIRFSGVIL